MANERACEEGEAQRNGHGQPSRKDDPPAEPLIPPALLSQYAEQKPVLDQALTEIRSIARRQIGKLKDRSLVHTEVTEARVKEVPSLWDKAQRNGWRPEEALSKATDAIGLRLVCNNLEDVARAKDLLLAAPEFKLVEGSLQEYFTAPQDTGYRATHFLVAYDVLPKGETKVTVTCEVQIRTYLADAWARLAHQDFYKEGSDLPPHLKRLFRRLADLLKVTDDLAQDIREEVSRPRIVEGEPPTTGIEPDSLAFIYQRAFGVSAPDYILRIIATRCREFNVTRSDALDRKLTDRDFLEALREAYGEEHGLKLYDEDVFELIPIAVAMGDQAALSRVKQRAQGDWDEIDGYYRSEMKAEWLPETFDEFMESLAARDPRDPDGPAEMVYDLARVFGATTSCTICGETVVRTDTLAEAIAEHYDLQDKMEKIEPELFESGVETGYEGGSTFCNHCGYMLNKDD